ncbi:MAG TPA: hypothetical protein PLA94_28845 [Myxococcota bacterium]|nr:hypothetical protein [Myxococcota bacterium]
MLFSLLLSCASTTESFWAQAGTLSCSRYEECDKADFEDQYDDQADCREEFADYAEDVMDCLDEGDCEYDPKDGAEVLSDYRKADCNDRDEAFEDISDVYNCDDEISFGLCLAGF